MSYKYVLDTFAWVEYFRGTQKGETVKKCVEEGACATPTIVIAELSDVYEREKNKYWERDLAFIIYKTTIVNLDQNIATKAGKMKNAIRKKHKAKFGLADAIILTTAQELEAKVVTGDTHFEKLTGIVFL
ncbi:MAG: PIN domain-containing protein [Candidatus Diapherotrites archaeon]|uniref:PIN domain-containing protein n=1 Tax=Candidatus Iainarchaeum sp. TaxID=3101447 RepID=A0A939C6W8_9ARCH|nr:PIN domain-containing protein [Candidatus Diapherotrites archaeon]